MSDTFLPKGVITPLVTPFRNDAVDDRQLRVLIERQISAGVHGLIVCDQIGEGLALTADEREVVMSCALDSANGDVSVIAAVGTNCTSKTVDIVAALPNGIAAILVTIPYYSKPTAKGVVHHFERIAETTSLPIIIDDDPRRTAKPLTSDVLEELRHVENIRGVRHCSGDVTGFATMAQSLKRRFRHYAGNDRTAIAYLMAGATSISSPIANLFPELVCSVLDLSHLHTVAGENAAHGRLSGAIRSLGEPEPPNLKYALSLSFECSPEVRLPLVGVVERRSRSRVSWSDTRLAIGTVARRCARNSYDILIFRPADPNGMAMPFGLNWLHGAAEIAPSNEIEEDIIVMPRSNQASVIPEPLQWKTSSLMAPQAVAPRFTIGRDSMGRWTVADRDDHVGGTFVSEAAAFSFARQEANHDLAQICRSPDSVVIEFSLH